MRIRLTWRRIDGGGGGGGVCRGGDGGYGREVTGVAFFREATTATVVVTAAFAFLLWESIGGDECGVGAGSGGVGEVFVHFRVFCLPVKTMLARNYQKIEERERW